MEAILFVGIQASGKTTFYREHFFRTHVRLSLDMLKTRHREAILVHACIAAKQPFVIDNTNPTAAERARYLVPARAAGFQTICYVFDADLAACLERNEARPAIERVPPKGIGGTRRRLEIPNQDEGFDQIRRVRIDGRNGFVVEPWSHGATYL